MPLDRANKFIKSNRFNNVRIKQDFDTPPGKRLVAAGSSAAAPHSGFDSTL
jgi:hypothetical protein